MRIHNADRLDLCNPTGQLHQWKRWTNCHSRKSGNNTNYLGPSQSQSRSNGVSVGTNDIEYGYGHKSFHQATCNEQWWTCLLREERSDSIVKGPFIDWHTYRNQNWWPTRNIQHGGTQFVWNPSTQNSIWRTQLQKPEFRVCVEGYYRQSSPLFQKMDLSFLFVFWIFQHLYPLLDSS